MDNKTEPDEDALLRLIASLTDEDSLDRENIKKALVKAGLDPDKTLERWNTRIEKILNAHNLAQRQKQKRGPKLS